MKKTNNVITEKVQKFYEDNPYPGLGDKLGLDSAKRLSKYFNKSGKFFSPDVEPGME